MKRSEAIDKLRDIILKHLNCGPECCGDDPSMYNTMLKEIETVIGMEPPFNQLKSFEVQSYINMWEPEDET